MKTAFDKLNESQTKLGQAIYASQQEAGEAPQAPTEGDANQADDDIVDAEIVDDEDENKDK